MIVLSLNVVHYWVPEGTNVLGLLYLICISWLNVYMLKI